MKKNDILLILVPSFIFVLAWIGFSIYHNVVTSTISEPLSMAITPISPTFDTSVIDGLKSRQNVVPIYELNATTQNTTTAASPSANQIVITPTVNSTNSARATSGGRLTP